MNSGMGFGPGNIDCNDVLSELTIFLDNETDVATKTRIAQHLDACSPCLEQYGLEKDVKALIGRCCGGDRAPETLRARISVRITEITVVE
ncbi:mycothiol system anti-sigma-R factor [uncultured Jatrophihabitans sp.]|uniref:mycothiol system anti-sigma-R factor n=1 Tax=uncultured Jatrophihabitans sp. TaxID=1610747 RepID=UPI0035CB643F